MSELTKNKDEVKEIDSVEQLEKFLDARDDVLIEKLEGVISGKFDELNQTVENKLLSGNGAAGNDKAVFKDLGELMQATAKMGAGDEVSANMVKAAQGAGEITPSEGGFLVSHQMAESVLMEIAQTAVVYPKTQRIPIGANFNGLKINTLRETSRADGSRLGGVMAYWAAEGASVTATKPKFARIELGLEKLMATMYATDELLEDSTALGAIARVCYSNEFGFKLDDGILNGTGAGQMLGIIGHAGTKVIAKPSGQAAKTIKTVNIHKMWNGMLARHRVNAVWYINQDCEPQLDTLEQVVGTGGIALYTPPGGLSEKPYSTLKGRQVIPIEHCSTLGTVGDIILANMSKYLTISKGALDTALSIHTAFTTDETCFRFKLRANGQPINDSTLAAYKGTATYAPFVTLATRS